MNWFGAYALTLARKELTRSGIHNVRLDINGLTICSRSVVYLGGIAEQVMSESRV
jgi:hypothetical protein